MTNGGSGATYVDDISLYYIDVVGDVNGDKEINIADINAVFNLLLYLCENFWYRFLIFLEK